MAHYLNGEVIFNNYFSYDEYVYILEDIVSGMEHIFKPSGNPGKPKDNKRGRFDRIVFKNTACDSLDELIEKLNAIEKRMKAFNIEVRNAIIEDSFHSRTLAGGVKVFTTVGGVVYEGGSFEWVDRRILKMLKIESEYKARGWIKGDMHMEDDYSYVCHFWRKLQRMNSYAGIRDKSENRKKWPDLDGKYVKYYMFNGLVYLAEHPSNDMFMDVWVLDREGWRFIKNYDVSLFDLENCLLGTKEEAADFLLDHIERKICPAVGRRMI